MADENVVSSKETRYRLDDFEERTFSSPYKSGSQGIVYPTCLKKCPGDLLAVKLFHSNRQLSLEAKRELELIKQVQENEWIVSFFGHIYDNKLPHRIIGYAMEYIPTSLEDALTGTESEYCYKLKEGKSWMLQLARALSHLHNLEILHRDIKPSNLLIKWNDNYKAMVLCDFGCGRNLKEGNLSTTTGTERYCAPELLNRSGNYGKPADVYSFGRVFWEVFHRDEAPFDRKEVVNGTIQYHFNIFISKDIRTLIQRCVCFNADDRPHIEEICSKLDIEVNNTRRLEHWFPLPYESNKEQASLQIYRNKYTMEEFGFTYSLLLRSLPSFPTATTSDETPKQFKNDQIRRLQANKYAHRREKAIQEEAKKKQQLRAFFTEWVNATEIVNVLLSLNPTESKYMKGIEFFEMLGTVHKKVIEDVTNLHSE